MHRGLVGEGRGEDHAQPDQGGREPFLLPVPPYHGTDPLELPRHALEIIYIRFNPWPQFEALAAFILRPHQQLCRLLLLHIGTPLHLLRFEVHLLLARSYISNMTFCDEDVTI